nr:TetR/AcrR family transcriptional regulator [Pelagibacterium xiamenense]
MNVDQLKRRPRRDAERTKTDILLAAIHEFSEYGDTGARIDRIAHRANANKALIYSYFGNKEGLYEQALREAYVQIRSGERALDLDALAPRDAIRALIAFTMRHFLESPWFLRLLTTENLRRGQTIQHMDDIASLQSPLINHIAKILERGCKAGLFRSDVEPVELYVMTASLFFFPLSNGYTLGAVFDARINDPEWRERYRAHAEEMVLGFLERRAG